MPVVRGIRVLNAISTGNTTPACLDTLLSDAGRLADVTQVLSSPSYSCMLAQSNTANHTAFRSNNAMNAIFANPVAGCVLYQTSTSRNNMLSSSCYYNHMMSFSTPEATNSFTHFGNTPCMLNCAFASCTAFLNTAVQSNTEIAKLLTCNACVSACFRGSTCAIQQAVGTPGRPAYWLGDATAFSCLIASGMPTAFGNTVFLETLNRDIACVMCTPALNCCAWNLAAPASTYSQNACAINEVVNKGACGLGLTSCNFVCWYGSTYGVPCMIERLASGNTYFMDQVNTLNSFRQKSCLYFICACKDSFTSCIAGGPSCAGARLSHCLIKTEHLIRNGTAANNYVAPMSAFFGCSGQRICPFTIANGSQLSNTEIEYLGRFSMCNYNVITHADCRFTLISPGFWNTSSMIACFKNCYCCSIDRTTANTSGLTLNCSLYYTADNGASFNRLCVPLPACIFQQLCGNCCCQFTVRYGLSSFACCNYIYTGWIISDCGTSFGCGTLGPAYYKTGHSRVCIFAANSQPDCSTWTHFPDVPLPFYTVTFCEDYFAGVSPMRTDGYQTTLGLCNQILCQTPGQWAMMFSFGKVGDCVRVSCDNFVNCQPANVTCFTPSTDCRACRSVSAMTHCNWGTCYEDYFQGHGNHLIPYCLNSPWCLCDTQSSQPRLAVGPSAMSHTLIWKNSACAADSKAFLAGWRSYGMLYGGTEGANAPCPCNNCAMVGGRNSLSYYYNCCAGMPSGETQPCRCGYFSSSAGLNVWCYGSQANNTMEGSEIACSVLGGGSSSWTNFVYGNVKIVGNKLVISGSMMPRISLCCLNARGAGTSCYLEAGMDWCSPTSGYWGCQNGLHQTGHVTLLNTDGVVGTFICCLDSMYRSQPYNENHHTSRICGAMCCGFCSARCFCGQANCTGYAADAYQTTSPSLASESGLRILNFYGTSNAVFSTPTYPNMVPLTGCYSHCFNCQCFTACGANCYDTPAKTGCGVFRSDAAGWCAFVIGDSKQSLWERDAGIFMAGPCCCDAASFSNNPGSNTIGLHYYTHTYNYPSYWTPASFCSVCVPPSANQDTTTYNFCYVLAPNHDLCLDGFFCWNQSCECFGPNCCLTVPCSPCCPCCNTVCCGCAGQCACVYTRADYPRAQMGHNYDTLFPCASTPARYCCPQIAGCGGIGNQHYVVAQANNTFQCAIGVPTNFYQYCCGCCQVAYCWATCAVAFYNPSIKTCNQAGANCMWYDFNPKATWNSSCTMPGWGPGILYCSSWNHQFQTNMCFNSPCSCLVNIGFPTDDAKRTGWINICLNQQCSFDVDGNKYAIRHARMTRGSGGVLNTQNSIHVAYFDLVPFRCNVTGGGGFYANGNACPSSGGITCCLMYVKSDIFFNV